MASPANLCERIYLPPRPQRVRQLIPMQSPYTYDELTTMLQCLSMRMCLLETGDPVMRAADAKRVGREAEIKQLNDEQKKGIAQLESITLKTMQLRSATPQSMTSPSNATSRTLGREASPTFRVKPNTRFIQSNEYTQESR